MTTGTFNTGNFTTDLAAKSFASMITRLMPNGSAPLFALSSMLPTETAKQIEHGFFTKTMVFPEFKIDNGAGYTAGATTFVIDATSNLLPGMILRNLRTDEHVIIDVVNSTTSIDIARSVGTVAAAAVLDNDDWVQVGNGYEESSTRPIALNIIPVRVTNLTQIFRNTWALSGSSTATQVIAGESPDAENRQDCAAFHATGIEQAMFFGQKSSGTRNGQPFRTMDGLINVTSDLAYYPDRKSVV